MPRDVTDQILTKFTSINIDDILIMHLRRVIAIQMIYHQILYWQFWAPEMSGYFVEMVSLITIRHYDIGLACTCLPGILGDTIM